MLLAILPICVIVLHAVFPIWSQKGKIKYLVTLAVIITFVLGSRHASIYEKGDLNNYYRLYYNLMRVPWNQILTYNSMEKGYLLLNKILGVIIPWPQFIIIFVAGFTTGAAFYFIYKNTDEVFIGSLTYMAVISMLFAMTGFRQALAISVILLSTECIKKKKLWYFLLMIALATSMHSSAIICIPIYWLHALKLTGKKLWLLLLLYLVAMFFIDKLLKFGNLLVNEDYQVTGKIGNQLGGIVVIAFYAISLILSYRYYKQDENQWLYCLGLLGLTVYAMQFQVHSFERVAFYFLPANAPLLSNALHKNRLTKRSRMIVYYIVSTLLIFYYYHSFGNAFSNTRFVFY